MVDEIVCLAACLARSVDTKLLTKSLRLPLTSGGGMRSACLMKVGEVNVAVGLLNGLTFLTSSTPLPF